MPARTWHNALPSGRFFVWLTNTCCMYLLWSMERGGALLWKPPFVLKLSSGSYSRTVCQAADRHSGKRLKGTGCVPIPRADKARRQHLDACGSKKKSILLAISAALLDTLVGSRGRQARRKRHGTRFRHKQWPFRALRVAASPKLCSGGDTPTPASLGRWRHVARNLGASADKYHVGLGVEAQLLQKRERFFRHVAYAEPRARAVLDPCHLGARIQHDAKPPMARFVSVDVLDVVHQRLFPLQVMAKKRVVEDGWTVALGEPELEICSAIQLHEEWAQPAWIVIPALTIGTNGEPPNVVFTRDSLRCQDGLEVFVCIPDVHGYRTVSQILEAKLCTNKAACVRKAITSSRSIEAAIHRYRHVSSADALLDTRVCVVSGKAVDAAPQFYEAFH